MNAYAISEDCESVDIFVSIYSESDRPRSVSQADIDAAIKRAIQLYHKAINDLYTAFQKDNDTYEFAITLHQNKDNIKHVRICALTNGLVKPIALKNITIGDAEISFSLWDVDRLYRCVTSGKMRETIEIDFEEKFQTSIPCIENNTSKKYSVYLAIINGDLLAALYDEFRDRLLEKNVRSFLQVKGGVNKGIRDTLRDEPDMFLAYNNGISVTAESVEIVRDENGKPSIKRIRDMQIVNGGQTTASIFNAKNDRKIAADLSQVFVQMKISVIHSADDMDAVSYTHLDVYKRQDWEKVQTGIGLRIAEIKKAPPEGQLLFSTISETQRSNFTNEEWSAYELISKFALGDELIFYRNKKLYIDKIRELGSSAFMFIENKRYDVFDEEMATATAQAFSQENNAGKNQFISNFKNLWEIRIQSSDIRIEDSIKGFHLLKAYLQEVLAKVPQGKRDFSIVHTERFVIILNKLIDIYKEELSKREGFQDT